MVSRTQTLQKILYHHFSRYKLKVNFNNLRKLAKHLTWPFVPLVRHQVGNNCLIVRQPEVENPCPIVSRILSKSQQVTRSSISFQMWRSRRYSLRGIGCLLLLGYKVFISPTFYEHLCHTKEFCSICTISYHQLSWRFKIVVLAVGILHGRPLSIALGGKNGQPRQGDVKPLWSQFLQHFTSIFVMSLSALTACVCNFFWRKEIGAIIYL